MHYYIYQIFQSKVPEHDWAPAWALEACPQFMAVADTIEPAKDRSSAIAHLGTWLKENRLGIYSQESFVVDTEATERHFVGRFAAFQQAIAALQTLHKTQFLHEHDRVQNLISGLCTAFSEKHDAYVLLENTLPPIPMDEFIRKARPNTTYYIGAVFNFHD